MATPLQIVQPNVTFTVGDECGHLGLTPRRTLGRSHAQTVVEPTDRWTVTDQRPADSN